jgi:hypothetical protein
MYLYSLQIKGDSQKKKKKKYIKQNKKLHGVSLRANYTDRLSAKLVPTFPDRGCHVVSMTDPYIHILGFLDQP